MSENIELKKETLWKIGTFVFAALFLWALVTDGGAGSGVGNVIRDDIPREVNNPPTSQIKVSIDETDPILGDENAEITIVEFSDFQCPFCSRAASGALTDFRNSDYFKNGQVNLVYKHFPLNSIHPMAQKAAEASECARRQSNDKFWEMHDKIFENQQALSDASLKNFASQIGLDINEFNSCLDGNEASGKVSSDLKQATDAGGQGTPYFVIINKNGDTVPVSGAQPWPNFEAAINSLQ